MIITACNEAKNLPVVFSRMPEDVHEVIVVDRHSVDATIPAVQALRLDAKIVVQKRRGIGDAMACGFAAATGDIIVMLEADGSTDPQEIPRFVAALVEGADFAKGTRFASGGGSSDFTRMRAWGNRWLTHTANVLFGTRYSDLLYSYNAFWRHCLPALELKPGNEEDEQLLGDGIEFLVLINARVAKAKLRIVEVPSFEFDRIHGESNLNTWRDGLRAFKALLVERLNSRGRSHVAVQTASIASRISPTQNHEDFSPATAHAEPATSRPRSSPPWVIPDRKETG